MWCGVNLSSRAASPTPISTPSCPPARRRSVLPRALGGERPSSARVKARGSRKPRSGLGDGDDAHFRHRQESARRLSAWTTYPRRKPPAGGDSLGRRGPARRSSAQDDANRSSDPPACGHAAPRSRQQPPSLRRSRAATPIDAVYTNFRPMRQACAPS